VGRPHRADAAELAGSSAVTDPGTTLTERAGGVRAPGGPEPAVVLLLDHYLDEADATVAAHRIVDAPVDVTFTAALELDLLEVRTPLLSASFWARGLPAKLLRRPEPPPPERITLDGALDLPGWMLLDRRPGHEIVFGAIGVFWTPTIRWNTDVAPNEFAAFAEPGWGKIACNYSTRSYGEHRTLLTYECRTLTTDDASRRLFNRYWWLIRPFVGHIMRATVATIGAHAEAAAASNR
jgi:hypothetical protein